MFNKKTYHNLKVIYFLLYLFRRLVVLDIFGERVQLFAYECFLAFQDFKKKPRKRFTG